MIDHDPMRDYKTCDLCREALRITLYRWTGEWPEDLDREMANILRAGRWPDPSDTET